MRRLLRLLRITRVSLRYGLDQIAFGDLKHPFLIRLVRMAAFGRRLDSPRAVRIRLALESLGPIFVKFGQMLSTRRDLLPNDIVEELAKLQDRVPRSTRGWRRARSSAAWAGRSARSSRSSTAIRWPAPRSPRCILPCSAPPPAPRWRAARRR